MNFSQTMGAKNPKKRVSKVKLPKLGSIPGFESSPDLFRFVNLYPQSHHP